MKDLTFEDKCHIISKNLVHGIFKSHNIHTLATEYDNIQIYDHLKRKNNYDNVTCKINNQVKK